MTRADTRLLFAILVTAAVTATATALIAQSLDVDDDTVERDLDARLRALEAQNRPKPVIASVPDEPEVPPPATTPEACDEVTCLIDNYQAPCCAAFRKQPAVAASTTELRDGLDRAMIAEAMARVKPRVLACGNAAPARGKVKLRVRVAPDGTVASSEITETPDAALGACISNVVSHARFRPTHRGGSFSYPFVF